LTLRQLALMAEGHGRDVWNRAALLCAVIVNSHVAKKSNAVKPAKFNPYEQEEATVDSIDELREFCKEI